MPRLKELIEAGLLGRGLIEVTSEELVRRYNAALEHFGLEPTQLTSFHVDRMGWSPEIAAEKSDDYYLGHGEGNPFVIIIDPDQANAPIYFNYFSFDWRMMSQWFDMHRVQVKELTKSTAICLDLDEDIDIYTNPEDLLMLTDVIVRASTPDGLMQQAEFQQQLTRKWQRDPDAHLDLELLNEMERSAQQNGDLRSRSLIIRDHQFSDVEDFYSRMFGGMFVLRSRNNKPLLFARQKLRTNEKQIQPADESAIKVLLKRGYVETDVEWWKDHLYRLRVVAESFLIDLLEVEEPELDYAELNDAKKKALFNKYRKKLSEYSELTRIRKALKHGELPDVDSEVSIHLLHPSDELSDASREVIWQLLTHIRGGRFVPLMYRHQKTCFQHGYIRLWNTPRRSWAVARVQEFYEVASKSSGLEL